MAEGRRQLRAAGEPVEILRLWQLIEQALQDPTERIGLLLNEGCQLYVSQAIEPARQ